MSAGAIHACYGMCSTVLRTVFHTCYLGPASCLIAHWCGMNQMQNSRAVSGLSVCYSATILMQTQHAARAPLAVCDPVHGHSRHVQFGVQVVVLPACAQCFALQRCQTCAALAYLCRHCVCAYSLAHVQLDFKCFLLLQQPSTYFSGSKLPVKQYGRAAGSPGVFW